MNESGNMTNPPVALADDMIVGALAIADHLGLTRRQIYAHVERGHLPAFRIGALLCVRKSTLERWIESQEAGN